MVNTRLFWTLGQNLLRYLENKTKRSTKVSGNLSFTVVPDMNLDNILIGMTHWNSIEGFGATAVRLLPQKEARDYFSSFNPLAYALLQTVDGNPFDFETIKKDSLVVEFAIRKGKNG